MKLKSSSHLEQTANHFIVITKRFEKSSVPDSFRQFMKGNVEKELSKNKEYFLRVGERTLSIFVFDDTVNFNQNLEKVRRFAAKCASGSKENKYFSISTVGTVPVDLVFECFLMLGISLYNFNYYKTNSEKKEDPVIYAPLSKDRISEAETIINAVVLCRDWVNQPVNILNASRLAEEFKSLEKKTSLHVTVLKKKDIQKLGMGGLLAVNQGSVDEPRFTILEYHPKNARNKKPVVLIGKGLVYDTGGLSLKPTPGSMDSMKCDMAGGATVAAAVFAAASLKLPLHVLALVPSTDNRPGFNAFAPGDIIRMMDGSTVEMLNSDAEGRMILADALHFAKRYHPEIVLEFSTLTGAAANAIGPYAMVGMGNVPPHLKAKIMEASEHSGERIAEFPFWDDYDELLKSDIADCKNIGGPVAGAITAGRFLKRFTDYPFFHLDIAGPAFIQNRMHYMPKGGTAFGVRFLVDFMKNYTV